MLSLFRRVVGFFRRVPKARVEADGLELRCYYGDGRVEKVAWEDLVRIEVHVSGNGIDLTGIWWELHSFTGKVTVPQGAIGDGAMQERMAGLPGYDGAAIADAFLAAGDTVLLAWARGIDAKAQREEREAQEKEEWEDGLEMDEEDDFKEEEGERPDEPGSSR
jgi:hypothetical protein